MNPDFADTFVRSEARAFDGQPLRLTDAGIWLPMPLDVMQPALDALQAHRFWPRLGDALRVLDAGMGDGRLVAALATVSSDLWTYGIEAHPGLHELARENLRALGLGPRWRVCEGDYLEPETYPKLGIRVEDVDVFFNYPDGNEQKLGQFLKVHARAGALLVLLTPERSLRVSALTLQDELAVAGARGFRILVHRI